MNGIDIYYQTQRGRVRKAFQCMRQGGAQELERLAQEGVEAEARNHCGELVGQVWHDAGRVVCAVNIEA